MRWVHRNCLNEWRAQDQVPLAFSHCPQCKFQYRTALDEDQQRLKHLRLWLFVARDTVGLFVLLQLCLAAVALLVHACDPDEHVVQLYPKEWAEEAAASRLSIGPYYVTTCIGTLALLAAHGM